MLGEAACTALFVFGRTGGNIIPKTVTIARTGRVEVDGEPIRTTLPLTTLRSLQRIARRESFAKLSSPIMCTGTLPDIATGFITYRGHTVREHGGCNVRFTTLYNALWLATGTQ